MAPALLALVLGLNIKSIHSAVDMGNQSTAACELFCIVYERLTIPIVRAFATCFASGDLLCRSLKLLINTRKHVDTHYIELFCPYFFLISPLLDALGGLRDCGISWVSSLIFL